MGVVVVSVLLVVCGMKVYYEVVVGLYVVGVLFFMGEMFMCLGVGNIILVEFGFFFKINLEYVVKVNLVFIMIGLCNVEGLGMWLGWECIDVVWCGCVCVFMLE